MSKSITFFIHLFAFISLYIISVVGLGWFWTIGYSDNYEKINNVLINLSYSYITGYFVYLGTVWIPSLIRSRKIKTTIIDKLKDIKRDLDNCLYVFAHDTENNKQYEDQELIEQYQNGDLRNSSFYLNLVMGRKSSAIEYLYSMSQRIIDKTDEIINHYSKDLPSDLLNWLESIKRDNALFMPLAYRNIISNKIQNQTNQSTKSEDNTPLAKAFITLRDEVDKKIVILNKTKFLNGI